jgi:hypothetical protein
MYARLVGNILRNYLHDLVFVRFSKVEREREREMLDLIDVILI